MKIIDAHHHLWNLDELRYPWLEEEKAEAFFGSYERIRRNYLLSDYLADCANRDVVKSVHLQAEHDPSAPVKETEWLQSVADAPDSGGFPHAIVAFADLSEPGVEAVLEAHCAYPNVRGIRQILNYHEDERYTYTPRNLLDDERWREQFGLLDKYGLSFDMQLYHRQMPQGAKLARTHPDTRIIVNHTGMPLERDEEGLAGWRRGMEMLAACDNVAVKISGLGMCDPDWTVESLRPFVLRTIDTFGVERCLFASNFPVDKVFSDYDTLFDAFDEITAGFSGSERAALFHDNAARFYRL